MNYGTPYFPASRDKHSQVNLIIEKLELQIAKLTAVKTGRGSKTPRPKRHTRSKHNQFSVGNQKKNRTTADYPQILIKVQLPWTLPRKEFYASTALSVFIQMQTA